MLLNAFIFHITLRLKSRFQTKYLTLGRNQEQEIIVCTILKCKIRLTAQSIHILLFKYAKKIKFPTGLSHRTNAKWMCLFNNLNSPFKKYHFEVHCIFNSDETGISMSTIQVVHCQKKEKRKLAE